MYSEFNNPMEIASLNSVNIDHKLKNDVYIVRLFFLYSLGSGNYSSAMRCYLEAGAISSFFFNSPVPSTVWDDQVETCGDELYSPVSQRVSKSSEEFITGDLTFIFLLFAL